MSESINSIKAQLWHKMSNKEYRDNFVAANLSTGIAAQIQTLREDRGWTQTQLGEKAGMTQARISLLEDPGYDKYTFSTLRRIGAALDVALIARFARYSELADWVANLNPRKLSVPSFDDDVISTPESIPQRRAGEVRPTIREPEPPPSDQSSLLLDRLFFLSEAQRVQSRLKTEPELPRAEQLDQQGKRERETAYA
jgi:transcriptional regulator with XRE-family HTH domain